MSRLLSSSPVFWNLGQRVSSNPIESFLLGEKDLATHIGIFGGSRTGKSKLLELLGRSLMDEYRGFCFIDPHGDTAEDLLAYASKQAEDLQSDAICNRIHYLEPSFKTVFGYDPLEFRPPEGLSTDEQERAYWAWLPTRADSVAKIVLRKQGVGDFQQMTRLERIMKDLLVACLVAIGKPIHNGKHLPLSDALVLLDTFHPRHNDVFNLVFPYLPAQVRGDFASLKAMRSEENRKKETESTINWMRSLLSPIVKAIFSATTKTIDFRSIIKNRGIVLVNLRKTDFFSEEQRNAIGGMLIHEILSTAAGTAREDRTPYYLIVDEARLFIGEDMMEALDQMGKFKLSICLAGQYLGQFKTDNFDMTPSILTNCKSIMCFQQKHPDELKLWKEYFGYANLSFEKHFQIADRPDGYDMLKIDDWSESYGVGKSSGKSRSITDSTGTSDSQSLSLTQQEGRTLGTSSQESISNADSQTVGIGSNRGSSVNESPIVVDGLVIKTMYLSNRNDSSGRTEQQGQTNARTTGTSETESRSASHSRSQGLTKGENQSRASGHTNTTGETQTASVSITHKTVPLARTREERLKTAQLEDSVEDQFHKFAHIQRTLPQRHAMVSLVSESKSFVIKVADVDDVYSQAEFGEKLELMKQKIYGTHPYYSPPGLSPAEQDQRLDNFLAEAQQEMPSSPIPQKLEDSKDSPID